MARQGVFALSSNKIPDFDGKVVRSTDADPAVRCDSSDSLRMTIKQMHMPRVLVRSDLNFISGRVELRYQLALH